jgi:hypothetical protein
MTDCSGFIQPFDFECIFVNYLSGDWFIFGLLAILFIFGLATTFRMSNFIVGASILLFAVMFYAQLPWILYVSLIIGGILIASIVASLWKR